MDVYDVKNISFDDDSFCRRCNWTLATREVRWWWDGRQTTMSTCVLCLPFLLSTLNRYACDWTVTTKTESPQEDRRRRYLSECN